MTKERNDVRAGALHDGAMVIHQISAIPTPAMQQALAAFDSRFVYPAGGDRFFRISYGSDHTAFVRSLGGEWSLWAAEREGQIVGTGESCVRQVRYAGEGAQRCVFAAEIRLLEQERRKLTAARLLKPGTEWIDARGSERFGIANDQTPVKPSDYTGRLGMAHYRDVGQIAMFRIPLAGVAAGAGSMIVPQNDGLAAYERLGARYHRLEGGRVEERSEMTPLWLVHPRGTACGRLEDRRKVIRLELQGGGELRPAFLSCFAFSDARDARELVRDACGIAAGAEFAALRGCMGAGDLAAVRSAGPEPIPAAASRIYGVSEPPSQAEWLVNGAEV